MGRSACLQSLVWWCACLWPWLLLLQRSGPAVQATLQWRRLATAATATATLYPAHNARLAWPSAGPSFVYDLLRNLNGSKDHSPGPRSGASLSALSYNGGTDMLLFGGQTYDKNGALIIAVRHGGAAN